MNTLIFRTMAPAIAIAMILFSILVLLRGHNAPGGGFIAGLIAAAAIAIYAMAFGVGAARRRLRINPLAVSGAGACIAALSGLPSLVIEAPFLTGLWLPGDLFGTPGLFDIGVYLTVLGAVSSIAMALEDESEEGS
jgi:multicomponent Na+:H+ antiporter subunit B